MKKYCKFIPTSHFDIFTLNGTSNSANSSVIIPKKCLPKDHEGVENSCHYLFYQTSMSDRTVGVILLVISLTILCSSLVCIVKILNSLLKGSIAKVIKKVINADIPYVPWLTGYIAIILGAILTFIVQSSSVFTSTLTPLIGNIIPTPFQLMQHFFHFRDGNHFCRQSLSSYFRFKHRNHNDSFIGSNGRRWRQTSCHSSKFLNQKEIQK